MDSVEYNCKVRCLIEQSFKMFDGILFRKVKPEFFLDLFVHITVFNVWNISIHHERHQIQNEIGALAKDGKGGEAEILEAGVMWRLRATHTIYHFFTNFDWRREGLWVSAQNVAEIN